MTAPTSYDWAAIVEQLLELGLKPSAINGAEYITHRLIAHYRRGVQPLHWRGEKMLTAWCAAFGLPRDKAPVCVVVRGHRVDRRLDPGPRCQGLPQWPVAAPVSVKPVKRKQKKAAAGVMS